MLNIQYHHIGFQVYIHETDALDRFGTKLEKRFTKEEIKELMVSSGLINIKFSDKAPYWVALGEKNKLFSLKYVLCATCS